MSKDTSQDSPRVKLQEPVKVTVKLSPAVAETLKNLASDRGVTMTEVLRQAISLENYMQEVKQADGKILVQDKRGNLREIVLR